MQIYPYWLDGVHRKLLLAGKASTDLHKPDRQAEWIIKWRALLPGSLVLSGPQITDHPLIWHLFRDPEFRRLLKESEPTSSGEEDRSFLRLVGPPLCGNSTALKWDIAITPHKRNLQVGRFGTAFKNPRLALKLEERLIELGPGADFERIKHEFKDSPDSEAFEGILDTTWYFAQPGAPTYPQSEPAHFYTFLEQALETRLTDEERNILKKTIELVKLAADRHPKGLALGRADVENTLDLRNPSHQAAWHTIVGSWNVAQQKTLAAKGSWGRLPNSVPIALYVTDRTLDGVLEAGPGEIAPGWPGFQKLYRWIYDPGFLGWGTIRELRSATKDEREKLQKAMDGPDEKEMLNCFVDAVRRHMGKIKNPIPAVIRPVGWFTALLYQSGLNIPIWPQVTGTVASLTTISDAAFSFANHCRGRLIAATVTEVGGKRLR